MKNLIIILSVIMMGTLASTTAYAGGCVSDTTCSGGFGAICPSILATATVGSFYYDDATVYAPDSLTEIDLSVFQIPGVPNLGVIQLPDPIPVISAEITDVTNLPDGISWLCGNCTFNPSVYKWKCIEFSGDPCGQTDTLPIAVTLQLTIDLSNVSIPIPGVNLPPTFDAPIPLLTSLPLVNNQPVLSLTTDIGSNYLCSGGSIELQAHTGFANYEWSTGTTGATDSSISVTTAGKYFVTVTDASNCTQEDSVEVFDLSATVATPADICANQYVKLEASGGDTYSWTPTAGLSDPSAADPLAYGITATTTYQVLVSNGTCSDSASVTVTVDNGLCNRSCVECDVTSVFCGQPSTGNTRICPTRVGPVVRNVAYDTTFNFYLMDSVTLQTVIEQLNIPIPLPISFGVGISEIEITGVDGLPSGLDWETDQLGGGNTYYPNDAPKTITRQGCVTICGNTCDDPGTYSPTLQLLVTVDVPGIGSQQLPTEIGFDFELIVAGTLLEIAASGSTELSPGDSVTLDATGAGFADYTWSSGETSASITVSTAGTYTVSVTDADGCTQTDEVSVTDLVSIAPIDALDASVNLFPNPTNGAFELSYSVTANEAVTISVIDIQGKTVEVIEQNAGVGANQVSVDLAAEATGLYFVKIETSVGVITRKVSLHK